MRRADAPGGEVVRTLSALLIGLALAGCRSLPPSPTSASRPPGVALVLGGGAARGFAHVGVIRVLEGEKIPIDLIVGTSVGSLVGALYAARPDSFQLEWTAHSLEKDDLFDFSLLSSKLGPVVGDRLEAFVRRALGPVSIESLRLPFVAVATDLNTGERVALDHGPAAAAVRASSAIPGIFHPVPWEKHLLVDGGVVDNVPVDVARERGARVVVAVDIGKTVTNYAIDNLVDVTLQALDIMAREISRYRRAGADVLIEPEVGGVAMLDFSKKKECIEAGMQAAREALPRIRQALARSSKETAF